MKTYWDIYLKIDDTNLFFTPNSLNECSSLYAQDKNNDNDNQLFNYSTLDGKISLKMNPDLCISIRKNGQLVLHEWENKNSQKFFYTSNGKLKSKSEKYITIHEYLLQTSPNEADSISISCIYKCIYSNNILSDKFISVYGNTDEYQSKELFDSLPKNLYTFNEYTHISKPQWTISCWLKIDKQNSTWQNIFKRHTDTLDNDRKPALWIRPITQGLSIHSAFLNQSSINTYIDTSINLNVWFHYVWIQNDSSATIYINGLKVNELNNNTPIVGDGTENLIISPQNNHHIRNFIITNYPTHHEHVRKLYEYEFSDQIYTHGRKLLTFHGLDLVENNHSLLWNNQSNTQLFTINQESGFISCKNNPSLLLTDVNGFIQLQPKHSNNNPSQTWFLEPDLTISNRHNKVWDTKYISGSFEIVSVIPSGNDKRWFIGSNIQNVDVSLNDGRMVFIQIPNHISNKEWLNSGGRHGYRNVSGFQTVPITDPYSGHLLWELLPDGHIVNTATREALQVLNNDPLQQQSDYTINNLVKNPDIKNIPEQLWTINGDHVFNNMYGQSMYYQVQGYRGTYLKNDQTLKVFNDNYIQRSRPLKMYNPKIQHGGKPYFDIFGNMVVLNNRSWKDRTGDYVPNEILLSYMSNTQQTWITYSLSQEIHKIYDLVNNNSYIYDVGYDIFYHSSRLVFNRFNHAFVIYGSFIVKFNYITGKILDYKNINGASKVIESHLSTNQNMYNDYPILVGLTLGLYNGTTYVAYDMNIPVPNNPRELVTTIQHSGMNTPGFTFNGKTFVVFSSLHGEKIDNYTYSGGDQTPHWLSIFDHSTLSWSNLVYLGQGGGVQDNHNGPSICIKSNGTIFVFFGNHNTPIDYVYTTIPSDINSFTEPIKFPSLPSPLYGNRQSCSYPAAIIDAYDNIYITYRGTFYGLLMYKIKNNSNHPTGVQLFNPLEESYPVSGKTYDKITVENTKYCVWRDIMTVDKEGTIYLSMSPYFHDQDPYIEAQIGKFTLVILDGDINTLKLLEY